MSNSEKIIKLLEEIYPNTLTSAEISQKLGIKIDLIYVYLNNLISKEKGEKMIRVNEQKPYQYKANTPKAKLNFLKELFEKGAIKVYRNKLNKNEMKELEVI